MQPRVEGKKQQEVHSRNEIQEAAEAQYAEDIEEEKERNSCLHRFFGCWFKDESPPEFFLESIPINHRSR